MSVEKYKWAILDLSLGAFSGGVGGAKYIERN